MGNISINQNSYKKICIYYRNIVFLMALSVFFIMLYNDMNSEVYKYYYCVPLIYGIFIISFKSLTRNIDSIGMLVLNGIMFIKYIIMPLIQSIEQYTFYRGINPNVINTNRAVLLTIYEMVMILITIIVFNRFFYKKKHNKQNITIPKRKFILICFIFIGLGIVFKFPSLVSDYKFVFSDTSLSDEFIISIGFSGLFKIIISIAKELLVLIIICLFKEKYDKTNKNRYIIWSIIVIGINISISQGLSRWSIMQSGIIYIAILVRIFPEFSKRIMYIFSILLISIFIIMSVNKFFGENITLTQASNEMSTGWWTTMLDSYFSGPRNIAIAMETKEALGNLNFDSRVQLLLNDSLRSVGGLSNFVDYNNSTNVYFNNRYYMSFIGKDQIIPIIGQSMIYFGYILSPILSMFFTIFMMWCDRKGRESSDCIKYYIFSIGSIWFARALMLNITILVSHFFNDIILFSLIYFINDKVYVGTSIGNNPNKLKVK